MPHPLHYHVALLSCGPLYSATSLPQMPELEVALMAAHAHVGFAGKCVKAVHVFGSDASPDTRRLLEAWIGRGRACDATSVQTWRAHVGTTLTHVSANVAKDEVQEDKVSLH